MNIETQYNFKRINQDANSRIDGERLYKGVAPADGIKSLRLPVVAVGDDGGVSSGVVSDSGADTGEFDSKSDQVGILNVN